MAVWRAEALSESAAHVGVGAPRALVSWLSEAQTHAAVVYIYTVYAS
jgi:hypothetical protein